MNKKIVLFLLTLSTVWGVDKVKFYQPSFNCENVKEGSIDYKICTDEEIARLDRKLSRLYSDAKTIDVTIKKIQRQWMKKRNKCKKLSCLKKSYYTQINFLNKKVKISEKKENSKKYLLLADKYAKKYGNSKGMKQLIAANHYYKLYINFSKNKMSEKRASDFINNHKKMLESFRFSKNKELIESIFPNKTIVYGGNKKECSDILQNAKHFKYINPVFDLASKKHDERAYLTHKKKCPSLFPVGGSPSTEKTRDYQRIFSIDIDKDGNEETIMQINRYSFNKPMTIKTIFDFFIVDFNSCQKERIVSRYYGDTGIYYEGFSEINGDVYYYEKEYDEKDKRLSLPSKLIKITDTKLPVGYIKKTRQYLGSWCTFDLYKRKYSLCFNYEDKTPTNEETKKHIDECTEFYKDFLKDTK